MNFIFISPNFPPRYFKWVEALKDHGKHTQVKEIKGRDAAKEVIAKDIEAYERKFPNPEQ